MHLHRFLPAQRHQERGLLLQVWARVRDGHVHAAQMPGVPVEEVSRGRHAAGVRRAGESVRHQAEGEEGAEGEGQGAAEPVDHHREYNEQQQLQVGAAAGADEV